MKWRWLIVLYPPAWRRRYADEFLAPLEQRSNSANTLLDVIASAVDAWLHPDLVGTQATPVPAGALARHKADQGQVHRTLENGAPTWLSKRPFA